MVVVGIDPGTATTGFGIICEKDNGHLEVIQYGVIQTSAGVPMEDRLNIIHTELSNLLLLHRPDSGAVEKIFFQRNVTTALSVGQARGVVLLALAQHKIAVAEYSPLEIKQAVVGYGGAEKNQVQEMVKALLQLENIPKPDDAADALAIAICHLNTSRYNRLVGAST